MLKWQAVILILTLANHIIGNEVDKIEKELLDIIDGMEKAKVDAKEDSAGLFEEPQNEQEGDDAILSTDIGIQPRLRRGITAQLQKH